MKLTRPSDVRALLAESDFRPRKSLGQNFLVDENILNILVESADIRPDHTVLEVGPGLGVLTAALADRARRVIAVEKDERLLPLLQRELGGRENVEFMAADAAETDLGQFRADRFVSNLPYSVGSRILMNFFEMPDPPERMSVTLQLEVAERLVAEPATKDYGVLTVWAQLAYAPRIHKIVSPTCFYPPPQVKSAIVVLARRDPAPDPRATGRARHLARRCFLQRRKQLGTLLGKAETLGQLGVDARRRPEDLAPGEWLELAASWPDA